MRFASSTNVKVVQQTTRFVNYDSLFSTDLTDDTSRLHSYSSYDNPASLAQGSTIKFNGVKI